MHRPICYILGILLTIPYAGYTADPTPKKCMFYQKLFGMCPVVQQPIPIVPESKNIAIAQPPPLQVIPQKSESQSNTNLIKVRRPNNPNTYELNAVDKTAGNNSLASYLLNIKHNNIIFNPVDNATVPTDKPKRKLIKVRR